MKRRLALVALVVIFLARPVLADLTLKGTGTGSGLGMSAQGQTVIYIQAGKMRSDWTKDGKTLTTILDLDAQKMTVIDQAKKKAEIYDLAEMAANLKSIPDGEMKVEFTPTGKSRTLLGKSCREYRIRVVAPYADPSGMSVDTVIHGTAWIAGDSPGAPDYRAFYLKAAEKGLFFNHPAAAKAQPGRAKGTITLYKEMAKAGIPYASDFRVEFEGKGLLAEMMSRMGDTETGANVTEVTTQPLSGQLFVVPAGYKVKSK